MAGRKKNGGSKRRTEAERFADALVEALKPSLESIRLDLVQIREVLVNIRTSSGQKR